METWDETGVSATHIDWTMVPYVRKSFYKHYKENLSWYFSELAYQEEYKDEINILLFSKDIDKTEDVEITFGESKAMQYLFNSDLLPSSPIEDEKYKQYRSVWLRAMKNTIKECQQAVEGMYHNLNTLQSRSGN